MTASGAIARSAMSQILPDRRRADMDRWRPRPNHARRATAAPGQRGGGAAGLGQDRRRAVVPERRPAEHRRVAPRATAEANRQAAPIPPFSIGSVLALTAGFSSLLVG